ncbi:MAG TPA: universal stress protein, partial [Phototrophicaceae bacterium]|nr:universal stress protein [Phototrophicaceae bacterium]
MLDHILVPLDGSSLAECVLPHVIAIARAFNAQITLVHILEQPLASLQLPKTDPLDWYLKRLAANLYLSTMQTRLEASHLAVQTMLIEGSAAEKIVELAYSTQTDLLILSGYGETTSDGGGVSSVVQNILQRVRTSTLIIRSNQSETVIADDLRYQRLLVPLDGSQRAGSALTLAAALAEVYQSELLLVHVVSKPEMPRHMPLSQEDTELLNRFIERNQAEGNKYLEQIHEHLPIHPKTRLLVSDNVAATLQSVSEQEQIDLMVLSAHGYSGEARWPYGSITNRF